MTKTKKQRSFMLPIALVVLGLVLSLGQFIMHAPDYLAAAITPVRHPARPDFTATDRLLREVVKDGLIDYDKVKSTPYLGQALAEIAGQSPDHFANKNDVLVFWINASNVLSIKVQSAIYGNKRAPLRSAGFKTERYVVAGAPMTVEQILQERLTPLFLPVDRGKAADTRAFLLLCRCTLGYPPMPDHAVTAESLVDDMAANTDKFVHNPANVIYTEEDDMLRVSPLVRWHSNIFAHGTGSPFIFFIDILMPDTEENPGCDYLPKFNWKINALNPQQK